MVCGTTEHLGQNGGKKKTVKKVGKKAPKKVTKKRKMNDFMKAKENARKNNLNEFEYTNKEGKKKTYVKFVMKTGMVAYKAKK
tara:strand:- start:1758 stop:2006 length:249 start_codon:yes stop_codon:yes gene_type:complete